MCDVNESEMFSENHDRDEVTSDEIMDLYFLKAGFIRRAFAFTIDIILVVAAYLLFFYTIMVDIIYELKFSSTLFASLIFLFVLFTYFYFIVLEIFWGGKTFGKWIAGIEVISADGSLRPWDVIVRNLLRCTHFIPPFFILPDLFSMIITRSDQTIGDIFAGTMVIRKDKYHK